MLLALALTLAIAAPPDGAPAEAQPEGEVLEVYLVRHGQAFSNLDPAPALPSDQLDRLTPLGREQAGETGRALAGRKPALILTSPAGRARETAQEIKQATGSIDIRTEPRLRPLEMGRSASGGPGAWDERIAEWKAGRDPVPPGGESLAQLGQRVLEAVRAEQKRHRGRGIVVVGHSDVIGAFLALARGEPGVRGDPFSLRNGSISLVELGADGRPALIFANRLPDELSPP